jgi:hypothetical protein
MNTHGSKFWKGAIEEIASQNTFNIEEMNMLMLLKFGLSWIDMVPQEWIDIYGAIYDESECYVCPEDQMKKIEKDVSRTYGIFSKKSKIGEFALHKSLEDNCNSLREILRLITYKLEYVQGMNYIAALVILVELSTRNCFILFCFLMFQRDLSVLFNHKSSSLSEYIKVFDRKLRKHNRVVYKHFRDSGYFSMCYAVEWFTTAFVVTHPGEFSIRVLDLIFTGLPHILIRTGLAIIDAVQDRVLHMDVEDLQLSFRSQIRELSVLPVITKALKICLTEKEDFLRVSTDCMLTYLNELFINSVAMLCILFVAM